MALLHDPVPPEPIPEPVGRVGLLGGGAGGSGRRYREARLEPGETVTIVGQALPWSDVKGQLDAALLAGNVDRDIADDIAQARASGLLAATPEEAWGNAAIPGFGIGQPTRSPELDPEVTAPEVPDQAVHRAALERYRIPDDTLVLARGPGRTFAVYRGDPVAATQHHDPAFLLGLLGIGMAVFSALALGVMLSMSS